MQQGHHHLTTVMQQVFVDGDLANLRVPGSFPLNLVIDGNSTFVIPNRPITNFWVGLSEIEFFYRVRWTSLVRERVVTDFIHDGFCIVIVGHYLAGSRALQRWNI